MDLVVKNIKTNLGLNWYDVSARNYDPALGRWMNMDDLAENHFNNSPYTYTINNPVYFADPDGNDIRITTTSDDDGNVTYNIHITAKIVNSSRTKYSKSELKRYC